MYTGSIPVGASPLHPRLALHVAPVVVLALLTVWFGAVDTLGVGESRCSSCGVEGYVIAVHVVAGAVLGVIVALARRGPRTIGALGVAAAFVAASVVWHPLFNIYGLAMLVASPVVALGWLAWWTADTVLLLRDRAEPSTLGRNTRARAWVALLVLLPGLFAWVWASRVTWLVF